MKKTVIGQCSSGFDTGIILANPGASKANGVLHLVNDGVHKEFEYTLVPGGMKAIMLGELRDKMALDARRELYQMYLSGDIAGTGCWCNAGTTNFFYGFEIPVWP